MSLAIGSEDGAVNLYSYPFNENVWDSAKAHRSAVTHINFSRDTNLVFSSGEDGNLFIYCIYELPDGENIAFDENKISNLNQLTSILDEGLGDNVLYPLDSIYFFEDKVKSQQEAIVEYKKQEAKLVKDHEIKIRDRGKRPE